MALIEFFDDDGLEWRAWDITPADMHPLTARDMFHGETAEYQNGWLVFQSAKERRRLAPFPVDWDRHPREALLGLLRRATPVVKRPTTSPLATSGEYSRIANVIPPPVPAESSRETPSMRPTPPEVMTLRVFESDSGRRWTVGVVPRATGADAVGLSAGRALRFTADDGETFELTPFPDDWTRLAREHLVQLLLRADPVEARHGRTRTLRRRDDFRP